MKCLIYKDSHLKSLFCLVTNMEMKLKVIITKSRCYDIVLLLYRYGLCYSLIVYLYSVCSFLILSDEDNVKDFKKQAKKKSNPFKKPFNQIKKLFVRNQRQESHLQQRPQIRKYFRGSKSKDGANVSDTGDQHKHQIQSSKDVKSKDLTSSNTCKEDHNHHQLSSSSANDSEVLDGETTNQPHFISSEDVISKDIGVPDTYGLDQYWHQRPPSENSGNKEDDDHLEDTSAGASKSNNAVSVAVDSDADYRLNLPDITPPMENKSKDSYGKDTYPREDISFHKNVSRRSEVADSHGDAFCIAKYDYVRAFQDIDFHKGTPLS